MRGPASYLLGGEVTSLYHVWPQRVTVTVTVRVMEYEKGDFIPVEVKHVNPKSNLKISNRVFMFTLRLCLSLTSVLHLCVCVIGGWWWGIWH